MYQPPRGTRDFLPEEMNKRNWVLDKIKRIYEIYGFESLGTPAFESWELLKVKSGDDIINQIYYFKDKSDRELGLRFEWTASLARVVATHRELTLPFKRYAIGPVWRYENPSEKRFREFWQADADIIGVSDLIADAEVIATAVDCLKSIGFEGFLIKLNDRRILESLIQLAGFPKEKSLDIFRVVDKLEKIGIQSVIEELSKNSVSRESSKKLLDMLTIKGDAIDILFQTKDLLMNFPDGIKGCNSLIELIEYSKVFGFYDYINIDLGLARGLDYYTGPVFEILAKGYESYGSIAGGGRYDELIGLFGGDPTPATGVALGVERIISLLEIKGGFKKLSFNQDVLVIPIIQKTRLEAIKITQELRASGMTTIFDLLGRKLSKQLEYASKKKINKVVLIGEKELMEGSVTIRNMTTGEQIKIKRSDLIKYLKS